MGKIEALVSSCSASDRAKVQEAYLLGIKKGKDDLLHKINFLRDEHLFILALSSVSGYGFTESELPTVRRVDLRPFFLVIALMYFKTRQYKNRGTFCRADLYKLTLKNYSKSTITAVYYKLMKYGYFDYYKGEPLRKVKGIRLVLTPQALAVVKRFRRKFALLYDEHRPDYEY